MEKRRITFGEYDTAANGGWTLREWALEAATRKENWVDVPGGHGQRDLSTVLTDGEPIYNTRTLTVTLESSEGTRLNRKATIDTMVNWLDGWTMDIYLPDEPLRYIRGVVHVEPLYNDPAHASVAVTAVCEPWRYNVQETVVSLTAAAEAQTAELVNSGRLSVVPLLEITGGPVNLQFGSSSWALSEGSYKLPDIRLTQGSHVFTYSGTGTVKLTYREAVL